MKKTLILLPLVGLFLASCGENNGKLPSGGKEVDLKNEVAINEYATKAAYTAVNSIMDAKSGFKAEASIKIDDFNISGQGQDAVGAIRIEKLELNANVAVYKLDQKPNEWEASVELAFKSGKINVNFTKPSLKLDLDVSNLKLAAYLANDNLYVDLSSDKLGEIVDKVLPVVLQNESAGNIEVYKGLVKGYLGKRMIKNFASSLNVAQLLPSFGPTAEELSNMISGINSGIHNIITDETLANSLSFVRYDDGRIGAAIKADTAELIKGTGVVSTGYINASVITDKNPRVSNISELSEFYINLINEEMIKIHYKGSIEANFKYGTGAVKLPDFSDYKEITLPKQSFNPSYPFPVIE